MDGLLTLAYAVIALIVIYCSKGQLKIVIPAVVLGVIVEVLEIVKMADSHPPAYAPPHAWPAAL
ncbi:hypothetical protein LTR78_001573 [Recurvomyces mirabilis]|uniref:Uncharacterized protein n=1 Tax=Recurvomyces mirabilis TaxID=574656 RepID=A0AAE0WUV5_9PEZI|nr:hypothetical protein LTR78_001573 [Recurvomyces mirabilis]KAK5151854.1 hypothetical protein LTS14_008988 [Recurvomyces mirabilis]